MTAGESKPVKRSLKDHEEFNGNNLVNIKLSATEDGMPVKKRFRKAHNDTQNCTEKVIPLPPPLINMSDFIHSNFEETEKNVKRKYCDPTTFSIQLDSYEDIQTPPYLGPYVFPENGSSWYPWPREILPYPGFKTENLKTKLRIEDICKSPNESRKITSSKKTSATLPYTLAALTGLPVAIKSLT